MEYRAAQTQVRESDHRIERAFRRAYVAAHLITGNGRRAEQIVVDAFDHWDPDWETDESLLRLAVRSAARASAGTCEPESARGYLPAELRAVLGLPEQQRRCYVLRVLEGLTRLSSAQLLGLNRDEVDQLTNAALKRLPAIGEPAAPAKAEFGLIWLSTLDWAD